MKKPHDRLKLAALRGQPLHPEDLSSKELNTSLIDSVVPDVEFRGVVERNIEEACRIGGEIAKMLDHVKPMARVMIVKTLYEHSLQNDRKVIQMLKHSGLWNSI